MVDLLIGLNCLGSFHKTNCMPRLCGNIYMPHSLSFEETMILLLLLQIQDDII